MKLIIVELFYRIYYALLTSCLLFCFAYFTLAIQYEYYTAYFANYYQACEFDFNQNIVCFEPQNINFTNLNKENNDAKAWSFLSINYNNYFFSYDLKYEVLNIIAMRNLFGYLLLNTCFQMHGFVLGGLLNIKRLHNYVILHLLILTLLFYYAFYNIYLTCLIDLLLEQLDSELIVN